MVSILWLTLWFAGLQAKAPPAQGSIEGIVVRAGASGAAAREQLQGARVQLKPGNRSTVTDDKGGFRFLGVTPGDYIISVARDGYIPQEDHARGINAAGLKITLAAGAMVKDIVFPMARAPVLAGTVVGANGEPQAAALVRAYHRQHTPYGTRLEIGRKAMANDFGEFRLSGLNSGEYFVSAAYSDHDRATASGMAKLSPNVAKADQGYATVFYDAAEEISGARAVHVAPGYDSGSLNFYFKDVPRFRIRGQVLPPVPDVTIAFAPKGSDLNESQASIEPDASGAFEIRGVSAGSYVLMATAGGGLLSSDVVSVNITAEDLNGIRLALGETAAVNGILSLAGRPFEDLSNLQVKLVSSSTEFEQTIVARVTADGTFTLEHVPVQGEYDVVIERMPPGTYVKSLTNAGRSLLQGKARLMPDQRLQIVLDTALGKLDVHVTKRANPAAGAEVILIPQPAFIRRADRYIVGYTDQSGDLHLTGIPPGYYTAYAFEQIEPDGQYALAYSMAGQGRFRDRSLTVFIEDPSLNGRNDPKEANFIQLRVIPVDETAGGLE
jgi:hypothetical protein